MPSPTDIIKVTFVSELSGVQMSNSVLWRIDALGVAPTAAQLLDEIATSYIVAVQSLVTSQWKLTCLIYENLSAFEAKQILFVNGPGIAAGDSHPQNTVLRVNRWGANVLPQIRMVRSSFSQSGVSENFSTRGRLNNATIALELQSFLVVQNILPTFGTVTPMVYGITIPDPPGPLTEGYQVTGQALVNPTFLKLASRKTSLCAA